MSFASLLILIIILFQVSQVDHGQWMCLINDNLEFNSVKQFLNLNVGVLPETGVSIEAGESFDADTETVVEVVLLVLVLGTIIV